MPAGLRSSRRDGILCVLCRQTVRAGRLRLAFLLPSWGPHKTIGRRLPPIRDYEIMFIVDPTLSDSEVENIQDRLRELAVGRGAEVKSIAVWERRRLAYPIDGRRDGIYVLAELRAGASVVKDLDQQLSVTENVLRHMVVRLEEEQT